MQIKCVWAFFVFLVLGFFFAILVLKSFFVRILVKILEILGAGETVQFLRALDLSKNSSLVPSAHGIWLVAACNSSSRGSDALFLSLWARMHIF